MVSKQTFGTYLRAVIVAVGTPFAEVAVQCGISRRSLHHYMSDSRRPSQPTLERLCEVLGLSPEDTASRYVTKKVGRPRAKRDAAK
jgi:transcriptional regulator with XRE-family HTH domain